MSDQSTGRLSGTIGPQPDTLESRLDALGRSIVEEESRRTEPPSAYLQAAASRAMFVRVRTWTPRLAVAAVLLLAGFAAFIFSRPGGTAGPRGAGTIATNDSTPLAPDPSSPTVGNLHTANRSVSSPDQLQLLGSGGASDTPENPAGPYRASDTRRPDRIDAILREK
jgi:hypothetical protein